ncbi:bifunctional diguanylate cyclase/phosphodiesterase [Agromyces sp. CF514]|uniref:putative bifunctional diguanylate cyclase/phosphodiesterase n=1 Tax=Agromyces sp. CF514 TaxID=1881031 RepID=UPI0015A548DC|nr:EAL domain-containing protein [Agromyces sp. CF514]
MGETRYSRWELSFLVAAWVVFVASVVRALQVVLVELHPALLVVLAVEVGAIAAASTFRIAIADTAAVPMVGMAASLLVLTVAAEWPLAGAGVFGLGIFLGYSVLLRSPVRAGYAAGVASLAAFAYLWSVQALTALAWPPPIALAVGVAVYLLVILTVEAARQRWRWTLDGSVGFSAVRPVRLVAVWAMITGLAVLVWGLARVVVGWPEVSTASLVAALIMVAGAMAFLAVAPLRRLREATVRLDHVVEAARDLPWAQVDDVEAHLVDLAREAVRAESVALGTRRASESEIEAIVLDAEGDLLHLVATRPLNALAFSANDRRVLDSLAHMGSVVMQSRADIRQLERRAGSDSLTGLPNHRAFQDHLEAANEARGVDGATGLAVLYVDVDDFKDLNDHLGHRFGDHVLQSVAARLVESVRPGDVVARLGGDEFAVILSPLASSDEARSIADRLLARSGEVIELDGMAVLPSLSVGVAYSEHREDDVAALVDEADRMMLSVKRAAKEETSPRMGNVGMTTRRSGRINDVVEHMIDVDGHRLAFQPVVSLIADRVWAFEALLRVRDANGSPISPDMFVEAAKQLGRFNELTEQIVHRALAGARRFVSLESTVACVTVNIDAGQMLPGELGGFLEGVVEEYPEVQLCLELNERSVLTADDEMRAQIARLRARGILIALDDYGSDRSSVASLVRVPMDILKIDRALSDSLTEPAQVAVLRALQEFGDTLDYSMVVEGVEDAASAAALREIGVRSAQGYYYGVPMTVDATAERLRRHGARAVLDGQELRELVEMQQFEGPTP